MAERRGGVGADAVRVELARAKAYFQSVSDDEDDGEANCVGASAPASATPGSKTRTATWVRGGTVVGSAEVGDASQPSVYQQTVALLPSPPARRSQARSHSPRPQSSGVKRGSGEMSAFREELKRRHEEQSHLKRQRLDRDSTSLVVRNLPEAVKQRRVYEDLFAEFGPLFTLQVQAATRGKRGLARVTYYDRQAASAALNQLNGHVMIADSTPLAVTWDVDSKHVTADANTRPVYIKHRSAPAPLNDHEGEPIRIVIPADPDVRHRADLIAEDVCRHDDMRLQQFQQAYASYPMYHWLHQPSSPVFRYLLWRIASLRQGESLTAWDTRPRRMPTTFSQPSVWWLPPMCPSTVLLTNATAEESTHQPLSEEDAVAWKALLDAVTVSRASVAECMSFAMQHVAHAHSVVTILRDAMHGQARAPVARQVARLFVLSDILFNAGTGQVAKASAYRTLIAAILPDAMDALRRAHRQCSGRVTADRVRQGVTSTLAAWATWAVYPNGTLADLRARFLLEQSDLDADLDGVSVPM